MKSKSSPSAPLNLCPPVGTTGTCHFCKGNGSFGPQLEHPCPFCGGSGEKWQGRSTASPVKDTPADKSDPAKYGGGSIPEYGSLAPASPVDSVGVPVDRALLDCIECLQRLPDVDGAFRVTCIQQAKSALASHAAKDARIADLEQALKTVLDLARDTPTDALVRFAYIRSRCRAALALPCA